MDALDDLKDFFLCKREIDRGEHRTVYANGRHPTSEPGVHVHDLHQHFADNVVITSKYKVWNFIPKNLFEQFRRVANFYFLCIVIVQFAILDRTPVSPTTSLLPLVFVITVTAIKQGYEDWKRHQADKEVNNRDTEVIRHGTIEKVFSKDIKVGDVVKVFCDEEFPCDLVVLSSPHEEGQCHITTANLDGETNLKVRKALAETASLKEADQLAGLTAVVECDHPEYDMYKFNGRMKFYNHGSEEKICALGPSNILLRGARLKNVPYVFGLAVYTGKETKMALNQQEKATKFSSVERTMNTYLLVFLGILLVEATICTALKYGWQEKPEGAKAWYIWGNSMKIPKDNEKNALNIFVDFLAFLILFNYVIPISLYVTVELQKFCGSLFFSWDMEMYHEPTDEPAKANTSDLNEELGQVQYLFSDKTGTLTENDMQFRQCSVNGIQYLEESEGFLDMQDNTIQEKTSLPDDVKNFLITLALCHTVEAEKLPEEKQTDEEKYAYQASSPDEKALVEVAARFGIVFKGRTGENMELEMDGEVKSYKFLHVLEFDSARKRMSNILETPEGDVLMLCKGAESHVLDRVISGHVDKTRDHIDQYAELGLRTLTIARRRFTAEEFKEYDSKLIAAQQAITDREEQLARVFDQVERDLELLGATAVEDRLQDGVKDTIESLRHAGIKVWVLTGDKQETAVNISHSCGHFQHGMQIMYLVQKKTAVEVKSTLEDIERRLEDNKSAETEFAVVVDGSSLLLVMEFCSDQFVRVGQRCVAVLCCRMSPLQKAQVVRLVKHSSIKPITMAIGDGANDCSMIQEAHVGCGIMGKEGRQAVRTSDYAFHRFKYLKRVVLVHGYNYYSRLTVVVLYFFYKNVAFITPQFYFQFFCGFSAMPIYAGVFLTCFNIFFTSLPILLYGVFEQTLRPQTLLDNPCLYRELAKNSKMSWKQFFYWSLSGIWHSLVVFFASKWMFDEGSFHNGLLGYGVYSFGVFVFTIVVFITNLKLSLMTHYWTWMTHFVTWGSDLFYFLFLLVLCEFEWPWKGLRSAFDMQLDMDLYQIIYMLMKSAPFWFGMIIFVILAVLPDILGSITSRHLIPTDIQKAQDEEKDSHHHSGRNQVSNLGSKLNLTKIDNSSQNNAYSNNFEDDNIKLIKYESKSTKNLESNA
ncbi:phospholipid-transporting ATPase IF-like isoform X1 [Rhopilema esculentum]|uniref:phospholipid-transporting ATPase IF-like isoform X1 n=1 Tax=Rhopilema esculentum TaxID=499914 RepID=UPI0031DD38A9